MENSVTVTVVELPTETLLTQLRAVHGEQGAYAPRSPDRSGTHVPENLNHAGNIREKETQGPSTVRWRLFNEEGNSRTNRQVASFV
jgi:hypothetical protein